VSPVWTAASPLSDASLTASLADGPLLRAVVVVAALLVARPVLSTLASLASALPGRAGAVAGRVAEAARPGVVRRAVALVLGLGLPAAPLAGALARPAPVAGATGHQAHRAHPPQRVHLAQRGHAVVPTYDRGVTGPAAATTSPTLVIVAPGDTLWAIAAARLPPGAGDAEIARAWPRWWAANRAAIGPDPALLLPGTRLHAPVPARRSAGTPTVQHHRPPTGVDDDAVARSLDPDRR
jgi:nucleoid-associated protein YgaU